MDTIPRYVFLSFVVMRSNFEELPSFVDLTEQLGAKLQLLHVVGDREGEDIFVRSDQHARLRVAARCPTGQRILGASGGVAADAG